MYYLQTLVTTLQAVLYISQPHAFHCVTETVPVRVPRPSILHAGDAIHPALRREWSGSQDLV